MDESFGEEIAKCESDTVSMALAGTLVEDPEHSTLWTKVDLQKSLAPLTAEMARLQTKDTLSDLGTAPSSGPAIGGQEGGAPTKVVVTFYRTATPADSGEVDLSGAWQTPPLNQAWPLLKADITKAHRRIKVLKSDWRYQVAQLGPKSWWVNKVGTYGMASAQLYWGRMAALLLCITYMIFPQVDWGFVFVDDFAGFFVLAMPTYGLPPSWQPTLPSEYH